MRSSQAISFFIDGRVSRNRAHEEVEAAPVGSRVTVKHAARRSLDQNSMMWVLLGCVAKQAVHPTTGEFMDPDAWKAVFMKSLHREGVDILFDLAGNPFDYCRSSKLSKEEMSLLIEFIIAEGTMMGVQFGADV